ncbi:MAG: type II secretion system F family protein [Akkermansiaceae bacterium]|nr:type II secretion system F family protein [Armatimonadota bacterium]
MTVSQTELNDFTRAFSYRIDSGERLTAALNILAAGTTNPILNQAATDISQRLVGGETLSQAMAQYPTIFDDEYRIVIRRGEMTGRLEDALRILA